MYVHNQDWHQPRYVDPYEAAIAQTYAWENQLYYQEQQLWHQQHMAMFQRERADNQLAMQYQIAGDEELRELSGAGYEALMALDKRLAQIQENAIRAAMWGGWGDGF